MPLARTLLSPAPRVDPASPVENAGKAANVVEIASGPKKLVSKKRKVIGVKPPKAKDPVVEKIVFDDVDKDQDE